MLNTILGSKHISKGYFIHDQVNWWNGSFEYYDNSDVLSCFVGVVCWYHLLFTFSLVGMVSGSWQCLQGDYEQCDGAFYNSCSDSDWLLSTCRSETATASSRQQPIISQETVPEGSVTLLVIALLASFGVVRRLNY